MEFPTVGKQCGQKDCGQLDFLPTECSYCHSSFCKDHLSPFIHNCKSFETNVLSDAQLSEKAREKWQVKCSLKECHAKELVPIKCDKCSEHFCLSHRHPDQHKCPVLATENVEKLTAATKASDFEKSAKEMQNKVKQDIANKLEAAKASGGSKGAMATKLALMKLKGKAKGDTAIPQTERVYFYIDCFNKEQNPNPIELFLCKKWSLGRAVDFIARQARVKNKNNQPDAPKLHLYKDGTCLSEKFDTTICECMEAGLFTDGETLKFLRIEN